MEVKVTSENFDALLAQDKPVVIDFWATWCGPCRRLAPVIEDLSVEYEGRVLVGKCEIEDCPDIAERLGIMSIPTVLFIKGGQIVDTQVGATGKQVYIDKIEKML